MIQYNKQSGGALYDLSKLKKIGSEDFVKKMLQIFIKEVPPSATLIKVAYDGRDFATVKYLTHRIRPSIQNMGIEQLYNEVNEIENLADIEEASPMLERMIEKLETITHQVAEKVKAEYNL